MTSEIDRGLLSSEKQNLKPDDLPRVLVFSYRPFNYSTGEGITLSNLFKGWGTDRVAHVHTRNNDGIITASFCTNIFYLKNSFRSILLVELALNLLHFLRKRPNNRHFPNKEFQQNNTKYRGKNKNTLDRLIKTSLRVLKLSGILLIRRFYMPRDFKDWLIKFDPEVIYCPVGSISYFVAALKIAAFCKAKLIIHIYDDWPSEIKYNNSLIVHWITDYYMRKLLKKADVRMVISDGMEQAYKSRYGLEFFTFHNCIDKDAWTKNGKSSWEPKNNLKIVFTGALYDPGNLRTITALLEALDMINKSSKISIELEMYTSDEAALKHKDILSNYNSAVIYPAPSDQDQIAKIYGGADALLSPLGFTESIRAGWKYSMPTKIPAYMFSGTPVIVISPSDTYLAEFINYTGSGFLISDISNKEKIAAEIIRFFSDLDLQKSMAAKAREIALREFDASIVRPRFREIIRSAARKSS